MVRMQIENTGFLYKNVQPLSDSSYTELTKLGDKKQMKRIINRCTSNKKLKTEETVHPSHVSIESIQSIAKDQNSKSPCS
jgi:hypothetical protein